jgi:glycosyltransferase involved in cell wall biosynthesis/MoaA/NifB/PqqE/SkfB family radical SAM enzyme
MIILKIIHGYPADYNAGSEVYTQSICNELSKFHKVTVFSREENPYAPDFTMRYKKESENLDFYFINMAQGKDGFRHKELDEKFAALVSNIIKPDVAHIGHLNHLSIGIVDELNKQHIPILFTLHDFWLMCPRGQFLQRNTDGTLVWQLCEKQDHHKCATVCYKPLHSGLSPSSNSKLTYELSHRIPKDLDALNDEEHWQNWIAARMKETQSIIDKIDLFIAPSNYLRNRFILDFAVPEKKIIYLDYGFPTEYLTQTEKSTEKNEFTFGYIGTHIPAKGLNHLIEAFNKIQGSSTLRIFGRHNGQSTAALKQLAALSKNRIEFAGEYINHNLANDVFSKVDCIVVPSIWGENSPLVIHEAQACKIPIITADFGGMKEYVQHLVNGLLFKHRNIDSLAEQLNFAVKNPSIIKQLGMKGYLYKEDGSIPSILDHCKELEKLYNRFGKKKIWRITMDTNPEDCNLNCIMCEEHSPYSNFIPALYRETGVKRRLMNLEDVEDIFQQAKSLGVKEIIPSTMGEPLLYNGIEKIFEFSVKHNIKINLTTNGTFPGLTIEEWAKLIIPNTTDVKISWNGSTARTMENIMKGLSFDKNLENVKRFIFLRNKYFETRGYYCRITFQVTFLQNNVYELAGIVKLAAELDVDRVKGHHSWIHFEELKEQSMKASRESVLNWNSSVKEAYDAQEKFRKPNGDKVILENIVPFQDNETITVPEDYECPFLEKELWISATGKISPCCAPDALRDSLGHFGTIKTTSLKDVLGSTEYSILVKNYKTKQVCKTCNMRKPKNGINK